MGSGQTSGTVSGGVSVMRSARTNPPTMRVPKA